MARVLFVCLHNAGRSQMSRALFDVAADGRHTSDSARAGGSPAATPVTWKDADAGEVAELPGPSRLLFLDGNTLELSVFNQ